MTSQTPETGRAESCAECGTRGEPGQSFCDACGAVLGWSGTPVAAPSTPDPTTAARPDTDTDTAPTTAPTTAPATTAAAPTAAAPPSPHHETEDEAPTNPLPAADPTPVPDPADRARSLLVPVADPEPATAPEPTVAPVLPGRPEVQRPQVRTPGPEFGTEGGVPCPWCGTPTRPDRHFCARCAMPMAGRAEAPGRLPWWRRMLNGRNTETPWAGDRPRLRRGFGRILNWVVGALVIALIVTLAFYADDGYQATRDHFAKRAPVAPDTFKASRSYPDHDAKLLFDKRSNTWWGPGVAQSGEGEWVEARFDQPTRLLDVIITPGVSTKVDQLTESALPHRIEARITAADGSTSTKIINLDQGAGGQRRKFRVGDVTAVRFILRSAYGADAKKQVAIAEIEFFGRSNSNT